MHVSTKKCMTGNRCILHRGLFLDIIILQLPVWNCIFKKKTWLRWTE